MSVWDALTTRQIARIVFTVAASAGLLYLLVQIRSTLLLLGIAIFLAVALGPAVDFFSKKLPRAASILLVYVLIVLAFSGVVALIVPPVIDGAGQLSEDIPGYIEDLRNNGTIKEFDDQYDITGTLQEEAAKLPSRLGDAAGALQSVATAMFNTAFQLLTVLTMTFFLLLDGKRITRFLLNRFGRERAPQMAVIAGRIYKSTAGYVAGALTISSINGLITFITLTILDVSFAVPLAVLMFFFGLIPLVGATIGGAIILVVTLFTDFPTATIVYAIVLILYQQLENNVLQPFVYKRTVNVPPLAVIVAILAGSSILGVLGALVAIPIAAAVQIVIREFYGLREPPADPPLAETEPGDPPPEDPPAPPSPETSGDESRASAAGKPPRPPVAAKRPAKPPAGPGTEIPPEEPPPPEKAPPAPGTDTPPEEPPPPEKAPPAPRTDTPTDEPPPPEAPADEQPQAPAVETSTDEPPPAPEGPSKPGRRRSRRRGRNR